VYSCSAKESIALLVYLFSCLENIFKKLWKALSFTKPPTPALTHFKAFSIGLTARARVTKPIRRQDYSFISTVDPLNHVY